MILNDAPDQMISEKNGDIDNASAYVTSTATQDRARTDAWAFIPRGALILAPMAGYTTSIYRRLMHDLGADFTCTEMISAEGTIRGQERTLDYFHGLEAEPWSIVQLFGSEPVNMARAAVIAQERGARIIDINMGCPVRKVVQNGGGAALMKNPVNAARIVAAIRRQTTVPVTVKIRAGWDASALNYASMALALEQEGAAAITLHPRTRSQNYSSPANWDLIADLVTRLAIPVIGNGDVSSVEDAIRLEQTTGCHGIMIGRAALRNPWLFRQISLFRTRGYPIAVPSPEDILSLMVSHLNAAIDHKGEKSALITFRKFMTAYLSGIRGVTRIRERLFKTQTRQELMAMLGTLPEFHELLSENASMSSEVG